MSTTNHKCIGCKSTALPGRRHCEACRDKLRLYMHVYRKRRLARGLCLCGDKVVEGKTRCERCAKLGKLYNLKYQQKKRDRGLCFMCRLPALPGRTRCATHAARDRQREARKREKAS